jgi:hypothetical protein
MTGTIRSKPVYGKVALAVGCFSSCVAGHAVLLEESVLNYLAVYSV